MLLSLLRELNMYGQSGNGQESVEIVRAENGFMIHVIHAVKNPGAEAMGMFGDIVGGFTAEGSDPISAFKKIASKKDMLEKTRRKPEEFYVAKNQDELMKILSEIFTSMEG